ncbi:rubredoxin [Alistipes shahii]|uniref:rubredoxin n=1 Tax=Alistipes shahii TaxID=328814 RepID=UPI0039774E96
MSAAPGTPSEEIPDDRTCPVCGVGKSNSEEVEEQPGKRGAAPKRSAPRHFGEPFQKNRGGGGYITFADFCYFCPSRTVRGQESNQYNDEKNPIPDGCNGHDVGV